MPQPVLTSPAYVQAAVDLAAAETACNDLLARIAAGHYGCAATDALIQSAVDKVFDARHALDQFRFDALRVDTVAGRPVCTNDRDDLLDALCLAHDRNLPDRSDPDAEHRLTAADVGIVTRRAA